MRSPNGSRKARAKRRRDELRALAEASGRDTFIDSSAPVARYFNATRTLLQQARVYLAEGRTPDAYVLYWRAATFFVERVSKHARYSHPSVKVLQLSCQKDVQRALQTIEKLEKELLLLYEMEAESDASGAQQPQPPHTVRTDGEGAATGGGGGGDGDGAAAAFGAGAAGALGAAASLSAQSALVSPQPLLPAVQAAMAAFARETGGGRRAGAYPTLDAAQPLSLIHI